MCTAATYKTKDFYFGRTLDYEFSYGDQIVITWCNYYLITIREFIIEGSSKVKIFCFISCCCTHDRLSS